MAPVAGARATPIYMSISSGSTGMKARAMPMPVLRLGQSARISARSKNVSAMSARMAWRNWQSVGRFAGQERTRVSAQPIEPQNLLTGLVLRACCPANTSQRRQLSTYRMVTTPMNPHEPRVVCSKMQAAHEPHFLRRPVAISSVSPCGFSASAPPRLGNSHCF